MRFFRRNNEPAAGSVRGTAVIRARRWASTSDEDVWVTSAPHELKLEVQLAGQQPYMVHDTFDVPIKFWSIARDLELPVFVNPAQPASVTIDWAGFEAAGGVAIVDALGDKYKRDAVRDVVSQDPVQRAAAVVAAEEWLKGLSVGAMSAGDFAGYIGEYVEGGYLTQEEADGFLKRATQQAEESTSDAPIEGVTYETWIAAVVGIVREKVPRSQHGAYYESHGFPAGRGEQVSAAWYARIPTNERLRDRYLRDTAS